MINLQIFPPTDDEFKFIFLLMRIQKKVLRMFSTCGKEKKKSFFKTWLHQEKFLFFIWCCSSNVARFLNENSFDKNMNATIC